jgi:O-antigen/teichoic acid export membrane protein
LWQLLPHFARFLLVVSVVVVSSQTSIDGIAAVYALVALVVTILGFQHLRSMAKGRFAIQGHPKITSAENGLWALSGRVSVLDIAREAWPFGLAGVFYLVYFQSDIILIKYLTGAEAAGIYNVAFTVMAAVYLLPSVIYQKFLLPKIHRWANHDRSKFLQVYRVGNGSMLMLGGATTVVLLLLVPYLIPKLFGTAYQPAIGLLGVLAFCAPVRFLATSVGATLVTQEHMRRKIYYMGIVAFVNLTLNLLLIPPFAAKGAAVATLVSEVTLLALYLVGVRRYVFGPEAWRGWAVTFRNGNV